MPAGYIDPETGHYIFGSTDPAGPMHDVLNRAQTAAVDVQLGNESRLAQLELYYGLASAATPWANVPSPHTGALDAGIKLRYRQVGDIIYLEGGLRIAPATAVYATIATLPLGYRPMEDVFTLGYNSNGGAVVRLLIRKDGAIVAYSPLPTTNDLTMSPVSFFTSA